MRAPRRRRVRDPDREHRRAGRGRHRGAADPDRARGAAADPRLGGGRRPRQRRNRGRSRRADDERGPPQRRSRDVPRQERREVALRHLRAVDARGCFRTTVPQSRHTALGRRGGVRGALPADRRPPDGGDRGRRGARALAASRARARVSGRLHPARGGDRPHPPARPVRAPACLQRRPALAWARLPRPGSEREHLGEAARQREPAVRGDDRAPRVGAGPVRAHAGDHREHAPRQPGGHRAARGAEAARRPDRDRRLRDRVLVAQLPAAVPGRHAQDREAVRRPDRRGRGSGAPGRRDPPPRRRRSAWTRSRRESRTRRQRERLRRLRCRFGQGFFFSPPLPATDMDSFLRTSLVA